VGVIGEGGRGCARAWTRERRGGAGRQQCSALFIGGGRVVVGKGNGGGEG
jgi:hypothetical protein